MVLAANPAGFEKAPMAHVPFGGWGERTAEVTPAQFWLDASASAAAAAEGLRLAYLVNQYGLDFQAVGRKMVHDAMTPLGAISTGSAGLAGLATAWPEEDRELIDSVLISGREIKHLLTRVGFMLSATGQTITPTTVDMTDVFWQLRESFEARFQRAGMQATWPEEGKKVRGVESWILRIWNELLTNAIVHNPPGRTLTITAAVAASRVRYTVRDNGPGVRRPPETLFVPLHRRDSRSGMGWGLTIVERLVALQGGAVGYTAPAGGGAEFFFELPPA